MTYNEFLDLVVEEIKKEITTIGDGSGFSFIDYETYQGDDPRMKKGTRGFSLRNNVTGREGNLYLIDHYNFYKDGKATIHDIAKQVLQNFIKISLGIDI